MRKVLSVCLALIMIISIIPMVNIESEAATFEDINQPSVFVKQQTSKTCTLASAVMLVRRAAMLNGNSNWSSITESSMRSTAWKEGAGLWYSFKYAGISVSHASLPTGSANKTALIDLLNAHPEGIILYYSGGPHAILLTDYTNGVFYCADPANNVASGRIPISQAYKVTISNATEYWYVSSPKCDLTTSSKIPEKPIITSVTNNNNGTVTIEWTACERAKAYTLRFYNAEDNTHFETLMGITTNTKYTHELPNGTYTVKVTAEGDGCWTDSEISGAFTISSKTPEKPVITSVTNNNNGTATIEWTACERAKAYTLRFYNAEDNTHFETLMGITTNTKYTHELPNGTYTVKVTAEGDGCWRDSEMSTVFTVSLKKPVTVSSISIATKPTKTEYYVGDTFNSSGLSVKVTMSDGTTKTLTSGFTVSSPNMSTEGTKNVIITYEGKITSFTINVVEKHVTPDVPDTNFTFSIQEPSRTEIRNKDGIILHANVEGNAPDGSYVRWESSNGNFSEDADGSKLEIIAKSKGWTTFTAILCDADGNELARDSVEMYSKSGFFDKIGGFFRSLFGTTKIYEN